MSQWWQGDHTLLNHNGRSLVIYETGRHDAKACDSHTSSESSLICLAAFDNGGVAAVVLPETKANRLCQLCQGCNDQKTRPSNLLV